MRILVDMGGTYVRFAVDDNGKLANVKKFPAADFKTFEDALAGYAGQGDGRKNSLLIASAAHPDDKNVWRFVNKNKWEVDPAVLAAQGWPVEIIINDFEAATWGLTGLSQQKILKHGRENKTAPRCLIGPGTGLGLGFLIPTKTGTHVQGTQGGHLATAALNDEHRRVLQAVDKIKDRTCLNVYEDVVSGPGLYNLYAALCSLSDEEQIAATAEDMFLHPKSLAVREALRLFHEFFALFAATVTVGTGAYGGLYLMGGVLDRLSEKNLFDIAHFEKFFAGNYVPSVKKALQETPIIHVTDPHISFYGLLKAANA